MKKFLIGFLSVLIVTIGNAKSFILPKNSAGEAYKTNLFNLGVRPGDTVYFDGYYSLVNLENFAGQPGKPIVFRNKGQVTIGAFNYGMILQGKYWILDGTADGLKYGIRIGKAGVWLNQGLGTGISSDYEIKGVEIFRVAAGIFGGHNGGVLKNISIHDSYIHHTDNPTEGHRCEGIYIGNTSYATLSGATAVIQGIEIYNMVMDSLGGDGIQLALATGVRIHHNTITNYALFKVPDQQTAILMGGCTQGRVDSNVVRSGGGSGLQVFGNGDVSVFDNIFEDVVKGVTGLDGIYIANKCKEGSPLKMNVQRNRVTSVTGRTGISNVSVAGSSIKGDYLNNTVTGFIQKFSSSVAGEKLVDSIVITPPPPPPPVTPKIVFVLNVNGKTYVITDDFKWRYQ